MRLLLLGNTQAHVDVNRFLEVVKRKYGEVSILFCGEFVNFKNDVDGAICQHFGKPLQKRMRDGKHDYINHLSAAVCSPFHLERLKLRHTMVDQYRKMGKAIQGIGGHKFVVPGGQDDMDVISVLEVLYPSDFSVLLAQTLTLEGMKIAGLGGIPYPLGGEYKGLGYILEAEWKRRLYRLAPCDILFTPVDPAVSEILDAFISTHAVKVVVCIGAANKPSEIYNLHGTTIIRIQDFDARKAYVVDFHTKQLSSVDLPVELMDIEEDELHCAEEEEDEGDMIVEEDVAEMMLVGRYWYNPLDSEDSDDDTPSTGNTRSDTTPMVVYSKKGDRTSHRSYTVSIRKEWNAAMPVRKGSARVRPTVKIGNRSPKSKPLGKSDGMRSATVIQPHNLKAYPRGIK